MGIYLPRIKKWKNIAFSKHNTPPYLIFFVTGKCNLNCGHCFSWETAERSGNGDLGLKAIIKISKEFGKIYDLLLSGGEPFLREDLSEIVRTFYSNNKIEKVCIPTNGYLPKIIATQTTRILQQCKDLILEIALSIDGTKEIHNSIRGREDSFQRVLETYNLLKDLKKEYKNLKLNVAITITNKNISQLEDLKRYVEHRMPEIDNIFYSFLRATPRDKSVFLPSDIDLKKQLILDSRNSDFVYFLVDALSLYVRILTLQKKKQILSCGAGNLIGVIDNNGDVRLCELLEPIGNLKEQSFSEIWHSAEADCQRKNIKGKKCFCTHECFIAPSIMYKLDNYMKSILLTIDILKTLVLKKITRVGKGYG